MKIQPIQKEIQQKGDELGFKLVYLKSSRSLRRFTPHCKKHGAMNKMESNNIWRCLSEYGREIKEEGKIATFRDRTCLACCQEVLS